MRVRGVRWRLGSWLLGSVVVLVTVVVAATASQAQNASLLYIRSIDSTDPANASIVYVDTAGGGASAKITVNGQERGASSINGFLQATPPPPVQVAMVVDTGPGMADTNALVSVRDAAKTFVRDATADNVEIAIYQAGDRGAVVQNFTSDPAKLESALDRLTPTANTALWSAIRQAGASFGTNTDKQHNVMVLAGDNDTVNPNDQQAANGAVLGAGASLFAMSYTGQGFDPGPLNAIVESAGGTNQETGDPGQMGSLFGNSGKLILEQQYEAKMDLGLQEGDVADITVTANDQTASASIVTGGVAQGSQALNPQVVTSAGGLAFLSNSLGFFLAILLVLAAVALFVYALTLLFLPENNLSNVLQPYADGYAEDDLDEDGSVVGKSAILQRAVELTEQVAESQGYLSRTEAALERANLPLRAGEALFFYVSFVLVMTIIVLLLSKSLILGLIVGVVAAMIPVATVNFLASRRQRAFMSQLPDTLQLLSGTLRAGYSLMQGVEAVAQEVPDPMGLELRRVVTESRLGRPLEESLEGAAERMDSADFSWAVMAIRIQREVGGNLAELLLTVAETMTARERLRRDVRTLTAEGRMSAIVLGILPIALGGLMFLINPEYMGQLYKTTIGIVMLVLAGVSMLIGFFWMRKIIDIEI